MTRASILLLHAIGTKPLISTNGLSCTKCQYLKLKFLGYKAIQFFSDTFLRRTSPGFIFLKRKKNNVKDKISR